MNGRKMMIAALAALLLSLPLAAGYVLRGDGERYPDSYFSTRMERADVMKRISEHREGVGYFPQNMSTLEALKRMSDFDKDIHLFKDLRTYTKGKMFSPEHRAKIEKEFGTKNYSVFEIDFVTGVIVLYNAEGRGMAHTKRGYR